MGRIPSAARCHKLPKKLGMDYKMTGKVLGTGFAGCVRQATSRHHSGAEQQNVAVKSIKLKGLRDSQKSKLLSEIEIFLCMDHPHVARLLDVYETDEQMSLVMECVEGGELFDRVIKDGKFTENVAADATRQMLLAVHYIHSHDIVHRDLKLENFLYDLKDSNHLKMIDFGFSKFYQRRSRMRTSCGTTAYVAPEVLERSYTSQCDLWSMGVICFCLLCGRMPFFGNSDQKVDAIKHARYKFKEEQWSHVSDLGKKFVQALLQHDPEKRLTSTGALEHVWITSNCSESAALDFEVVNSIVSWMNAPKLQRACLSMVSWSLTNKQHALVRDYFMALDKNHDGCLQWAEIKDAIEENKVLPRDEKMTQVCEIFSSSPDTSLTYSDFLAAMTYGHIDIDEANMHSAFRKFDTDMSGKMTTDGLKHVLGDSFEGEDLGALVSKAGVLDADGKIGFSEFARVSLDRNDIEMQPPPVREEIPVVQEVETKDQAEAPCCSIM